MKPNTAAQPGDPRYCWQGLSPLQANIPMALRAIDQWVCWRAVPEGERTNKIPLCPLADRKASSTDAATWADFESAWSAFEDGTGDGVGFVLTKGDGLVALDFDHVIDTSTGEMPEAVSRAIKALGTYAETSPSGAGVRIVGRGELPDWFKNGPVLQAWSWGRFVTITGHRLSVAEDVAEIPADMLEKVLRHFCPPKERKEGQPKNGTKLDIGGAVGRILSGESLHDSLRDLSASLTASGVPAHVTTGLLEGAMDCSAARTETPERWQARRDQIQMLVSTARDKFGGDSEQIQWPEPEPLGAGYTEPLPFPVDALPAVMQKAVTEYQSYGKQPMPLVASSALAAASVAAQAHSDIARDAALVGPMSLFLMPVAESGERKSAADNVFGNALRGWEERTQEAAQESIKRAEGKHKAWAAKMKGLERVAGELAGGKVPQQYRGDERGANDILPEVEQQIEDLAAQEPSVPTLPRLLFGDTTIEGLAKELQSGLSTASLWEDEGGTVFGSVGVSEDRLLGFLTGLSKLWDGKPLTQTRASVDSRNTRLVRFSANVQIQPFVLAKLAALMGGAARNTGWLARLLICEPQSTMGTRDYSEPRHLGAVAAFNRRITQLMDTIPASEDRTVLTLSEEAHKAWLGYYAEIEDSLLPDGDLHDVRDFASKSAEQAARIAGVFHVFQFGTDHAEVAKATMECAIKVARWFLVETTRVFALRDIPEPIADAMALEEWLCEQSGEAFTAGFIARTARPRVLRTSKKRRDAALHALCGHGHLREHKEGNRRTYYLHPEVRANVVS